jgi:hypothetical protein
MKYLVDCSRAKARPVVVQRLQLAPAKFACDQRARRSRDTERPMHVRLSVENH